MPAASGRIARALRIRQVSKLITCLNRNEITEQISKPLRLLVVVNLNTTTNRNGNMKYAPDMGIGLLCPAIF